METVWNPVVIAGALVTIISSVTTAVVIIMKASTDNLNARNADRKADILISKTDEIHTLANSNLKEVQTKLDTALAKVVSLEELITSMGEPRLPRRK